ncbi:glycosyltransferase family 4 protein [Cellulophaga baltica]|uniref:Glycosyltransferase involved in cell wall bisynthesis n=1 Tax=Cellulophaga baltica TaxID=76594 RepID=A0A1G7K1I8_9FLAO|nr:glycosyltransferase family 4 protein [Cellulophaga baltica]SDF31146.1 Glycosyltransferase involved in cell wall bisynthesis [Cellulophaga baltica]
MKIDFIISALHGGGAERVMVLLAEYFSKKGHIVKLITFNDGEFYELNENITRVKLHHGRIKNHKIRSFINLHSYYKLKSNRPDFIISFLTLINLITIIVAKIYGINIIASEHINHLQQKSKLALFTKKYIYKYANYITVLTSYDINYYKKLKANVVVMPNPSTFSSFNEIGNIRDKSIIAVGNLDRYNHKGFDNLISIVAPIFKKYPDWTLKIIGAGDVGKTFLKNLVEKHNINSNVEFFGFKSNVSTYMQESEIFVLPSRFEGLPMVLIEAMSQGMACIAYDCVTGPSDIIENNYNGLLIVDQDSIKMREGIISLINDENLRAKLKNNSTESIKKYDIENIYQQWLKLLKDG